ncbi:MAG: DUF2809 domain-containing protein [Verrucomicrobiota bacterium]
MPTGPKSRAASRIATRILYGALAAGTIILGLWVHRTGAIANPAARDMAGDALWAVMMTWLVGAILPGAGLDARCALSLGICLVVELSQLWHAPAIDSIRGTTLGHLVLGSGFDRRDLLAYALGVTGAALLEWTARLGRRRRFAPASR